MQSLMNNTTLWIALASVLLFAVLALLWRSRAPVQRSTFVPEDWKPKAIRPLTRTEIKVLQHIHDAVPECLVLPQVSLSRFINVRQNQSYSRWFQRVGRRCVDFLICSAKGDVLGVVEIAQSNAKTPSRRTSQGQDYKDRTLKLATIPMWRFASDDMPSLGKLRELIMPELSASIAHSNLNAEWHHTELVPREGGIEVVELEDTRWNQEWPTEENRPSAYLDNLEEPSGAAPLWDDAFGHRKLPK
jgi:Protein of unknown function (DUF2726)